MRSIRTNAKRLERRTERFSMLVLITLLIPIAGIAVALKTLNAHAFLVGGMLTAALPALRILCCRTVALGICSLYGTRSHCRPLHPSA